MPNGRDERVLGRVAGLVRDRLDCRLLSQAQGQESCPSGAGSRSAVSESGKAAYVPSCPATQASDCLWDADCTTGVGHHKRRLRLWTLATRSALSRKPSFTDDCILDQLYRGGRSAATYLSPHSAATRTATCCTKGCQVERLSLNSSPGVGRNTISARERPDPTVSLRSASQAPHGPASSAGQVSVIIQLREFAFAAEHHFGVHCSRILSETPGSDRFPSTARVRQHRLHIRSFLQSSFSER